MLELIKRNAWISALLSLGLVLLLTLVRQGCGTGTIGLSGVTSVNSLSSVSSLPSGGSLWPPALLAALALCGLFVWMEHFVLQSKRDYLLFPLYSFFTVCATPLQPRALPYLALIALGLSFSFLLWHLQGEGSRRSELFSAFFFYAVAVLLLPPSWVLAPVLIYGLLRSRRKGSGRLGVALGGLLYPIGAWVFIRWMAHLPIAPAFQNLWAALRGTPGGGLQLDLSALVFWAALLFFYLQTTWRILGRSAQGATQEVLRFYECLLVLVLSTLAGLLLFPAQAACIVPILCLPLTTGIFWKYTRQSRRHRPRWLYVLLLLALVHFVAELGVV